MTIALGTRAGRTHGFCFTVFGWDFAAGPDVVGEVFATGQKVGRASACTTPWENPDGTDLGPRTVERPSLFRRLWDRRPGRSARQLTMRVHAMEQMLLKLHRDVNAQLREQDVAIAAAADKTNAKFAAVRRAVGDLSELLHGEVEWLRQVQGVQREERQIITAATIGHLSEALNALAVARRGPEIGLSMRDDLMVIHGQQLERLGYAVRFGDGPADLRLVITDLGIRAVQMINLLLGHPAERRPF
jgi:hypothetical protein